MNQGFLIDLKTNKMKKSKFFHQVGPINHWQNSVAKHKRYTCYMTDELQLLRFDHQTCDWSTHELMHIDWATQANTDELEGQQAAQYEDDKFSMYQQNMQKPAKDKKIKKEKKEKKSKKQKKDKKEKKGKKDKKGVKEDMIDTRGRDKSPKTTNNTTAFDTD